MLHTVVLERPCMVAYYRIFYTGCLAVVKYPSSEICVIVTFWIG